MGSLVAFQEIVPHYKREENPPMKSATALTESARFHEFPVCLHTFGVCPAVVSLPRAKFFMKLQNAET
jgi:hypothetical protein